MATWWCLKAEKTAPALRAIRPNEGKFLTSASTLTVKFDFTRAVNYII
jgi:hypothetical protein